MKRRDLILIFAFLFAFKGHSQLSKNEIDSYKKEIILAAFSEVNDFSRLGLKWGMSKYEAEGYLKNLKISGKVELAATGKLFGFLDSDFILFFKNDKLTKISNYRLLKEVEEIGGHMEGYTLFVSVIHNFLNPANRISKLGVRDFFIENPKAQDVWVYNDGKSAVVLNMQPQISLDSKMTQTITFYGSSGSDVVLLTIPEEFISNIGVEATNVFYKKISTSSIPIELKRNLGLSEN